MGNAYNTDGMYGMPVIDDNCLNSIERTIAFDVRDWSQDRRSAWIYGIVFGFDEKCEEDKEIAMLFKWNEEDIKRLKKYHNQWMKLQNGLKEEA